MGKIKESYLHIIRIDMVKPPHKLQNAIAQDLKKTLGTDCITIWVGDDVGFPNWPIVLQVSSSELALAMEGRVSRILGGWIRSLNDITITVDQVIEAPVVS